MNKKEFIKPIITILELSDDIILASDTGCSNTPCDCSSDGGGCGSVCQDCTSI